MARLPPLTADTDAYTADGGRRRVPRLVLERLRSLLPTGWFSRSAAPTRDALFGGVADALTWIADRLVYARRQTRIASSTGLWVDLAAWDFFGPRFMRRRQETDEAFRPRILAEIARPRATRQAVSQVLEDLTGRVPTIFEPWHPGDCGAYGVGTLAYAGGGGVVALVGGYGAPIGGYGVGGLAYLVPADVPDASTGAGCWGSLAYPDQIFITVHRGTEEFAGTGGVGAYGMPNFAYAGGQDGVPQISGYGGPLGGYGVPSGLAYIVPHPPFGRFPGAGAYGVATPETLVTDAEIYARIAETVAAGVIPWTAIDPS